MKHIVILFLSLLCVFFIAWGIKVKSPVNRPSNSKDNQTVAWYDNNYTAPKANENWILDESIPDNYIPVPGEDELYMVIDDNGMITMYRTRTKQPDGSYVWETVNPDIPDSYEPVDGIENLYKVVNGDVTRYLLYVRNADDTYCFVECDENGMPLDVGTDATVINTDRYIKIEANKYALYNENGVLEGYRERVENPDGDGYVWKLTTKPIQDNTSKVISEIGRTDTPVPTKAQSQKDPTKAPINTPSATVTKAPEPTAIIVNPDTGITTEKHADGTYTETQRIRNTETVDGYKITYEAIKITTYDKDGNVLTSKVDGPNEISREKLSGSEGHIDQSLIAATLQEEYARVSPSVKFDDTKEAELLAQINSVRISKGLPALQTDSTAVMLAKVRAADMAIYNHSTTSPMYGTIEDMARRWDIRVGLIYENLLKTPVKDAQSIYFRFQGDEVSNENLLTTDVTGIGIGIVEKDSQNYVAIIFI